MVLPMQKAVLQPGKYAKVLVDGERIDYGGGNVIVERNEFGIQQFIPDDYLWIKQVERKLGWKTY